MKLRDGAQIGVLAGTNSLNPFAMYITEILETEGFCYQLTDSVTDGFDLLVIPDIRLSAKQQQDIADLARAGGNILCLHPSSELSALFGLKADGMMPFALADRYLRMRDGTVLQYHGPASLLEPAGAEALAYLERDFDSAESGHPAVVVYEDGGRRAAFLFDIARSAVLFHQGRADQASNGTNCDVDGDGCFRMNNLFINHLDPRLKMIPQADVLQDLLVKMIYWLTEKASPVPRIWHFPHAQPSIAFFNGDSDALSHADMELAFGTAETYGCKYTLYLMTNDFGVLPPDELRELCRNGHDVGVHPWAGRAPDIDEFSKCLKTTHQEFASRYGYVPATVRNHFVVAPGWVDTPRVLSDVGVRMDLNPYPTRDFQCGFITGSGLPVKLMTEGGTLIDHYQQCTIHADDAMLEDKCNLPAKSIDQAIETSVQLVNDMCRRYHGVYQVCFHPIRLQSCGVPTIEWYRAILEYVRSLEIPSVNGREWCYFNDARREVAIKSDGESWRLSASHAIDGLTVLWPERVRSVIVDGSVQGLESVNWGEVKANYMVLDLERDAEVSLALA